MKVWKAKPMTKYDVTVEWTMQAVCHVEANSPEEAAEIARNSDEIERNKESLGINLVTVFDEAGNQLADFL